MLNVFYINEMSFFSAGGGLSFSSFIPARLA
jgi:hypothetical protein